MFSRVLLYRYNLACCFSLSKQAENSARWLEKAIQWGLSGVNIEKESDFKFLKKHAAANFAECVALFKAPEQARQRKVVVAKAPEPPGAGDNADDAEVSASNKRLPSRSTRGARMAQLVGEEADADQDFWVLLHSKSCVPIHDRYCCPESRCVECGRRRRL